jgi:pimeloyl-ACP methyl ester carboxylesterase
MTISFMSMNNRSLAVEIHGSGPLVVCSPAMGDTRDAFDPLAQYLTAHGFRVAQIDLRGHGDSDADFPKYGDEATANDLLAVIDQYGDGHAYVVGASMSAAAAVIAAGKRPDAIAGMVLVTPFLRGDGAISRVASSCALARPWGPYVWQAYSSKLWPGLGDEAKVRAAHATRLLTRSRYWRAFTRTTKTDHSVVEPWFSRINSPSLIVMGTADPDWKSPSDEARWAAEKLNSQILLVPGAGHAPMLESPEIVSPRIVGFLKGLSNATRRS